ncbi:MAG: shikimate dehydrogenase [Gammaproteobacteria bacterium]|nr:shikimate dehydrogenase [Gammaproteobacteria bacterium]MCP5415614.1 shikimate dehydrogenase [Chromatiaceae bacterium]
MAKEIKLGLLGNGIGRSRAKSLHELIGGLYGLNVHYWPMDLAGKADVNIGDELIRCREEGYRGVNVTHPYKRDAFRFVDVLSGFPAGLTSVNTVVFDAGRLMADNTDYNGFCRAYITHFSGQQKPGRVLMLGSGGVGLAIAYGLQKLGASELVVFDKNLQAARDLIANLNQAQLPARNIEYVDLIDEMRSADGLINATPVGMFQYPGNPFPQEGFANQRWAFDAVYTPERTVFLEYCRRWDIDTVSGFKLFLYQGLDAFRLFTNIDVDAQMVEREFLRRYPLDERALSA